MQSVLSFFLDSRFAPGPVLSVLLWLHCKCQQFLQDKYSVAAASFIKLNISEFSHSVTLHGRGVSSTEIISLHLILMSQTISVNVLQICSQARQ